MKLRASTNYHIYVSMIDLYITTIGLTFCCRKIGGLIVGIYKVLTDT
jgi:hypothetical protein